MLRLEIKLDKRQLLMLETMPKQALEGTIAGVRRAAKYLEGQVKRNFGRQGFPGVRTGRLRGSITSGVSGGANRVEGYVGTDVIYAPVHEFGATITAKNAKYLKFETESGWRTATSVHIPARPFLGTTLEQNANKAADLISETIIDYLTRG